MVTIRLMRFPMLSLPALRRLPTAALDLVFVWQQRIASREALAAMDERLMRDIGISAVDVTAETGKPFWRG